MSSDGNSSRASWSSLVILTLLVAALYVTLEWLFLATMPSFMSVLSWPARLLVLLRASLVVCAVALALLAPFQAIHAIPRPSWLAGLAFGAARLVPAVMVGSMAWLLADNFTYTVFGFGISTASSALARGAYAIAYVGAIAIAWNWLPRKGHWASRWSLALPAVCASILIVFGALRARPQTEESATPQASRLPNIVLIGMDGMNAANMSVYGYERDTTPALRSFSRTALVASNNFPNSGHTGSSLASIFTGRLPLELRMVFPPDILRGDDAYRHLPGLLRRLDYSTMSVSMRHYADAYDFNLRGGFDECNGRRERVGLSSPAESAVGGDAAVLLLRLVDRLGGRVRHVLGVDAMGSAYEEVTEGNPEGDSQRLHRLFEYLGKTAPPFFIHVHLLKAHGPRFNVRRLGFSSGKQQTTTWMTDFYDDVLAEFDSIFRSVMGELRSLGLTKDTIVILYSDHGTKRAAYRATPLMFWFPDGEHAGSISATTQNADIAPTILDYLGHEVPEWMTGISLLSPESRRRVPRPVFGVHRNRRWLKDDGHWQVDVGATGPPFYTLGFASVVICGIAYYLDLEEARLHVFETDRRNAPCDGQEVQAEEALELLLGHLEETGYDPSSLSGQIEIVHSMPEEDE